MKSGNSVMRDKMYPLRLDKRDGKETKKNHQLRRHPSSQRELGKRESITHLDRIRKGIHFFNKVCNKWKKQAIKNKEGTWEHLEAEWNEYIEVNDSLYFYRRSRKTKLK